MLLQIQNSRVPMKLVYQLTVELRETPDEVKWTQELTLDRSRSTMGLKGTYGLFASDEWWENITNGTMPLRYCSGIIHDAYVTGQDESGVTNTIDLVSSDGTRHVEGIYTNVQSDVELFRAGHRVDVVYALDDLKDQADPHLGNRYLPIVLEMAVSTRPTE